MFVSRQTVPVESGNVNVWFDVRVARSRVPKNDELLSENINSPVFATLNLVVPDALAARISPEFCWLTIRAALFPIPPDIERGAGVVAFPINTDELKSDERVRFPVPFGESVRSAFDVVPIVAAAPPPRFKVVESIERIAAASIVARLPALMVVRPDAESVVSLAAIVRVLFPESRVSVFVVDAIVPASVNVRESISRTVPSIDMFPALPSSSIVIEPVPAATSNSAKLIAVAPPLIEVSDVPFRV